MGLTANTPGGAPQTLVGPIIEEILTVLFANGQTFNDLNVGDALVLRLVGPSIGGSCTINGIVSRSLDSRPLTIVNEAASGTVTIVANAGGSAAANRFGTNSGVVIPIGSGESYLWSAASGRWIATSTAPGAPGLGTVTQVNTGTGLTGGPITTTGTIALANTAVVAGPYTATNLTVDAQGRITAASSNVLAAIATSGSATDLVAGTLAAARFGTLTGDVTTAGGSYATTIANSAVTNAKMANMNNNTVKGNVSGGAAAPSDLTATQLAALTASGLILLQNGIPMGIPSSGTIGNNGALSGVTAFLLTYPDIYLFFKASAIFVGSTAGFYYCQMSSTTAGTIFNNAYVSGKPTIPAVPTPFVTVGPGAYVQTTATNLAAITITLPGGTLLANGEIQIDWTRSQATSANNKRYATTYGGTEFQKFVSGSAVSGGVISRIRNRGKTNLQFIPNQGGLVGDPDSQGNAPFTAAIDSTVNQDITLTVNIANAADWQVYETLSIKVFPSA